MKCERAAAAAHLWPLSLLSGSSAPLCLHLPLITWTPFYIFSPFINISMQVFTLLDQNLSHNCALVCVPLCKHCTTTRHTQCSSLPPPSLTTIRGTYTQRYSLWPTNTIMCSPVENLKQVRFVFVIVFVFVSVSVFASNSQQLSLTSNHNVLSSWESKPLRETRCTPYLYLYFCLYLYPYLHLATLSDQPVEILNPSEKAGALRMCICICVCICICICIWLLSLRISTPQRNEVHSVRHGRLATSSSSDGH